MEISTGCKLAQLNGMEPLGGAETGKNLDDITKDLASFLRKGKKVRQNCTQRLHKLSTLYINPDKPYPRSLRKTDIRYTS